MNAETLRLMARDPAAFRDALVIPSADQGPRRFRDVMAPFQRTFFSALDPALVALSRGHKPEVGRFWTERTKGGSKDSDCCTALLWLLAFTQRPLTCQVGAADQEQAGEIRKVAKDLLHYNPWLAELLTVNQWAILNPHTGSECSIIACDARGSHGARPDFILLNELTHIGDPEFAQTLLDNAAKVPNGVAIIATNAGFTGTWQNEWRDLARETTRWFFHKLAEPAPWIEPAELEEARRRNPPSRYSRLWRGLWLAAKGEAIAAEDIERALVLSGPQFTRERNSPGVIAGLDLGLKNDRSALVILGVDNVRRKFRLLDCQAWAPPYQGGSVDLSQVEGAVVSAWNRYEGLQLNYDPYQAVHLAQRLGRLGVSAHETYFTSENQTAMATNILRAFRNADIELYRDSDLIRDLGKLSIQERPQGFKLVAARDEHGHADRAFALAMALIDGYGTFDYLDRVDAEARELAEQRRRPWRDSYAHPIF